MRRKDDTLRDTLLDCAHGIAETEGLDAINIRSLAQQTGIATGTVYNYFANKDDILLALTEAEWRRTLAEMHTAITADCFCDRLVETYNFLRERIDRSAGLLMRSLGGAESVGQERMRTMQTAMGMALVQQMEQDRRVREDIWNETFTKERYAHFIMMNMTMLLQAKSPDLPLFIEIVKRTIY